MLVVRRMSVKEAASKLRLAGVISYSTGKIQILDRSSLRRMSQGTGATWQ
jgi:hypothetical protein